VDRVSLTGGTITYRDLSPVKPVEYRLQDLVVELTSVGLGQTPKLRVNTLVQPVNLPITIDGTFGPLKETTDIESADFELSLGKTRLAIKGSSVSGLTQLNISSQAINTADLPVALPFKKPVEVKDLQLTAHLKGQEAHVDALSFQLFNGQVKAQSALTLGAEAPPFAGKVSVKDLQLGPVLEALGTDQVSVSGAAALDLTMSGRGFSMPDLTRALEGAGRFAVKDGKLEGINLLQEAFALLRVAGIPADNAKVTAFSTIEGDVHIKNGLITVQRFLMDSHDFQATAVGTVGFDQTLNLKANLNLSEALSQKIVAASPAAKLAMAGGRMTVPLLISGTAQAPVYGLDTKAIGAKVQKQVQEKVQETVQEMLKSKSTEEAVQKGQEALKKLFGR
jgi:AsmA protein